MISRFFILEGSFSKCLEASSDNISEQITEALFDQTSWFLSLSLDTQAQARQIFADLSGSFDVEIFNYLSKGRVLDLDELRKCFSIFSNLSLLMNALPSSDFFTDESLNLFVRELKRNFLKKVENYLTPTGWDFAHHPQMGPIILKLSGIERRLRAEVQGIMREDLYQNALQFDQYDVINNRFVIPIQSDHFKQEMGNIIAHSSSGRTLFVEPFQLSRLSSERLELESLLEAMQYRFSIDVCSFFNDKKNELEAARDYLTSIDQIQARAAFAYDYELTRPKFTKNGVDIEGFYHPLVVRPIRNDIKLNPTQQSLIISGPNTGGKTVLLKSLAICFYFTQLGFFLPARQAKLPFFRKIFYFSNDHQNLMEGLSSFASEAGAYLDIVDEIDDDTCLFIDEIFNSTGSEEASALAMGFFKRFFSLSKRCLLFVSTHHQLLKTLTHNMPPFLSGHMGFNTETNSPTYRLYTGLPGSSMAFEIFSGLKGDIYKKDILEQAAHILGQKKVTYEGLLTSLSTKQAQLDQDLRQVSTLKSDLKNQKQSSEGLLFLERQKVLDEYRKTIDQKIKRLEEIIREAREKENANHRTLLKNAQNIAHEITPKESYFTPSNQVFESNLKGSEIEIGKHYRSLLFNCNVEVIAINERRKEAQINIKGKNVWTSYSALAPLGVKQQPKAQVSVHVSRYSFSQLEIDGRGKRLEEFEREITPALDALLAGDIPFLTVIHGHGEGILKRWLRTLLSKNSEFYWEPSEGNDGSTLIKLSR